MAITQLGFGNFLSVGADAYAAALVSYLEKAGPTGVAALGSKVQRPKEACLLYTSDAADE